jgi:hypothetical protein
MNSAEVVVGMMDRNHVAVILKKTAHYRNLVGEFEIAELRGGLSGHLASLGKIIPIVATTM